MKDEKPLLAFFFKILFLSFSILHGSLSVACASVSQHRRRTIATQLLLKVIFPVAYASLLFHNRLLVLELELIMNDPKWDADKMLSIYIHDYMLKKNLNKAARTFRREANLPHRDVAIDYPGGFLLDWWSMLYDMYRSRERQADELRHEHALQAPLVIDVNQESIHPWLQQYEMNQRRLGQLSAEVDLANTPAVGMLAAKIYEEERLRHPLRPNIHIADGGKMTSHKAMVQSLGNVKQRAETQQRSSSRGGRQGVGLSWSHPTEPTLYGVPRALTPLTGLCLELNKGVNPMPLSGWPLAGINQIPPGLGKQVLKSHLQTPIQQQFQMLTAQQQQELIAQSRSYTPPNLMSSVLGASADLDLRRLMLLKAGLNVKDDQMSGSVDSPKSNSSSTEAVSKMGGAVPKDKMRFQMREIADEQQQQFELQKQELPKAGRKRKELSSSGAASGTVAGDTPGTFTEPLMALCDKGSTPTALSQNDRSSGKDGKHDMTKGQSKVNVQSFLSHDTDIDDLRGTPFSTLLQSSTASNRIVPKGFSFEEICSQSSSKRKVLCCHFSSDGKLLASAGHDKKVVLWNLDTFDLKSSSEDHSLLITDVRFRQSSSILATASFDKTVQIWDSNDLSHSLSKLIGHSKQVMSLDFHPHKMDLLCSCDVNNEILLWNVNHGECTRTSKGGTTQVRFQSQLGELLAAASANTINLFDVETGSILFNLEGHIKEVQSVCWDTSGKYIASVSEDRIRVWSVSSGGECVLELCSCDNKFQSCIFHPQYSLLLVIGGYQSLELWDPMATRKMKIFPAHDGLITALADSPCTEMIASTSHDGYVKLWK